MMGYPSPLGSRKLELISSSFIALPFLQQLKSYISPRRMTPGSGNWANQSGQNGRISTNLLHPVTSVHKISNLQPFLDWISFRKRNTISFWEIASCWTSPSWHTKTDPNPQAPPPPPRPPAPLLMLSLTTPLFRRAFWPKDWYYLKLRWRKVQAMKSTVK